MGTYSVPISRLAETCLFSVQSGPDRGPRFFCGLCDSVSKKISRSFFTPLQARPTHPPVEISSLPATCRRRGFVTKRFIQFYLSKSHISYVFCEDFVGQRGIFSASQENLQRLEGTLKDLVAICVNFRHCRVAWYCSLPNALTQPFDFSFLFNKRKGFVIGEWGIF